MSKAPIQNKLIFQKRVFLCVYLWTSNPYSTL